MKYRWFSLKGIPKKLAEPTKEIYQIYSMIRKASWGDSYMRQTHLLRSENEKYSYEIDIGKYPPVLTKRLGNLSIDIQKVQDNPEEKEKEQEYTNIHTEKEKIAWDINTDLSRASIGNIHLDSLSKEELIMLTNSSIVEQVQSDISKPLDNQTLEWKITSLKAEVSALSSGGKSLDRSALLLAIDIYQSKLDIQKTGVGNITTPTEDEKDRMKKLEQIRTLQKVERSRNLKTKRGRRKS